MACTKHVQRKRPNTCPDCSAELSRLAPISESKDPVKAPNEKPKKAIKEPEQTTSQRTSREMLAEMEKEEEAFVIKKLRKKKEKVEEPEKEHIDPAAVAEIEKKIAEAYIDDYFNDKLIKFKQAVSSIGEVRWEHLSVPAAKCSSALISTLEKDGWKYVDMYIQADIIRISGFKEPVAVFQRIKSDRWKKTVEEHKKENK